MGDRNSQASNTYNESFGSGWIRVLRPDPDKAMENARFKVQIIKQLGIGCTEVFFNV